MSLILKLASIITWVSKLIYFFYCQLLPKKLNMHRILFIKISSVGIFSWSVYSYPKYAVQLRMWILW